MSVIYVNEPAANTLQDAISGLNLDKDENFVAYQSYYP